MDQVANGRAGADTRSSYTGTPKRRLDLEQRGAHQPASCRNGLTCARRYRRGSVVDRERGATRQRRRRPLDLRDRKDRLAFRGRRRSQKGGRPPQVRRPLKSLSCGPERHRDRRAPRGAPKRAVVIAVRAARRARISHQTDWKTPRDRRRRRRAANTVASTTRRGPMH